MAIRYIDADEVRFTPNDGVFVDVEFAGSGEVICGLEPRRLFPTSGLTRYITLLDKDGNEQAVIRDLDRLLPDAKAVIENALAEYYRIPRITRFIKTEEKFGIWMWTVDTTHGEHTFEIRHHLSSVKPLYDGRVLIKDANDNRYEIPDVNALDKKSKKMILPNL
ncbi:MAG: DUF1854 domain-containing protein [Oscillospiraceae bacterium]|jgi:hypothetical protein|nr:DUF1854 domain-containing protein [Oscillospiraceae bacterium]